MALPCLHPNPCTSYSGPDSLCFPESWRNHIWSCLKLEKQNMSKVYPMFIDFPHQHYPQRIHIFMRNLRIHQLLTAITPVPVATGLGQPALPAFSCGSTEAFANFCTTASRITRASGSVTYTCSDGAAILESTKQYRYHG